MWKSKPKDLETYRRPQKLQETGPAWKPCSSPSIYQNVFSIYGTHYNHLEEWLSGQRMLDTHQESLMADVESQASTWTMSSQLMLTILVQGPYLENFCPLYPLLVLMSQQPVCLQDTLFNSIYARHYRPEAVSTSLGICLPNSTKTHFHSSRR